MNPETMRRLSAEFYRYLSIEKDVSANTKKAYEGDIREFLGFVTRNGFEDVDQKAIRAFMADRYGNVQK